ncbi:alpha/beta hydrolase [Haloferula rosea]|uniref:Alpha/beta hydrolase n=1 Tax=Haloferula rosea TaxID=490093 RepID=A0A934R6C6_9BACT|nr:alpha/beta fold hydrolase [Haloferula rosea]MBK1826124.1 alpha/beta hydrolase [Haloferula rosea]
MSELPTEFRNRCGEMLDVAFHPGTREKRLLVLGHGVTGDMDRPLMVAVAEALSARGWPCLRMSFSGNGSSDGDFEEATITKESEDLQDLIEEIPADVRIAYCGHSMGGAVGLTAASLDQRIEVLITLAGMVFTEEFLEREFGDVVPDKGLMWDEDDCPLSQNFVDDMESIGDLLDEAGELGRPYLLIHGTDDDVVPPEDSEQAFEHAAEPKKLVMVDGAGHSFEETGYGDVNDAIGSWLEEHLS